MSTTASTRHRRPLSGFERGVIWLHFISAAVVGVLGFAGATDPEFGGLQRVLIGMLIGLWVGGILAMTLIARLVDSKLGRAVVLLVGPFLGIALLVGSTTLRAL